MWASGCEEFVRGLRKHLGRRLKFSFPNPVILYLLRNLINSLHVWLLLVPFSQVKWFPVPNYDDSSRLKLCIIGAVAFDQSSACPSKEVLWFYNRRQSFVLCNPKRVHACFNRGWKMRLRALRVQPARPSFLKSFTKNKSQKPRLLQRPDWKWSLT